MGGASGQPVECADFPHVIRTLAADWFTEPSKEGQTSRRIFSKLSSSERKKLYRRNGDGTERRTALLCIICWTILEHSGGTLKTLGALFLKL